MAQQALIIGLGHFGMSLARSLAERGVEVLAADSMENKVEEAARFCAQALCLDATDEHALAATSPNRRDFAVCGIGDEARDASIVCTALLRQLGCPRVIARAADQVHERILTLVGAHEVVNPEKAFGERIATRLLYSGILDEIPLGTDLVITEVRMPKAFVGHTLAELELPRRHGVTVIALRDSASQIVTMPTPRKTLEPQETLLIVSGPGTVAKMMKRL